MKSVLAYSLIKIVIHFARFSLSLCLQPPRAAVMLMMMMIIHFFPSLSLSPDSEYKMVFLFNVICDMLLP